MTLRAGRGTVGAKTEGAGNEQTPSKARRLPGAFAVRSEVRSKPRSEVRQRSFTASSRCATKRFMSADDLRIRDDVVRHMPLIEGHAAREDALRDERCEGGDPRKRGEGVLQKRGRFKVGLKAREARSPKNECGKKQKDRVEAAHVWGSERGMNGKCAKRKTGHEAGLPGGRLLGRRRARLQGAALRKVGR